MEVQCALKSMPIFFVEECCTGTVCLLAVPNRTVSIRVNQTRF
jgi:hypothetical protein